MAENWPQEQQDAYNDLAEDGVFFTFSREDKGTFDPVTGSYPNPPVVETFTAPGIIKRLSSNATYQNMFQPATTIEQNDKILLVAAMTYTPDVNDILDLNGVPWRIVAFSILEPGILPLLWYIVIRKA